MPSLYSEYVFEREGVHTLETEHGFITYKFFDDVNECYIRDVYVIPEKRQSGLCFQMAEQVEEIAKARGCKYLTGSVAPGAVYSTSSIQVLIKFEMNLLRTTPELIFFIKSI